MEARQKELSQSDWPALRSHAAPWHCLHWHSLVHRHGIDCCDVSTTLSTKYAGTGWSAAFHQVDWVGLGGTSLSIRGSASIYNDHVAPVEMLWETRVTFFAWLID
jgi:hypothetical protein